jgi:hypothetical protein
MILHFINFVRIADISMSMGQVRGLVVSYD